MSNYFDIQRSDRDSLTAEQRARAEALRVAHGLIRKHTDFSPDGDRGARSTVTKHPDAMDIYNLASWIVTGADPWATS